MFPNGNPNRIILVVSLLIGGCAFFGLLCKLGEKYLDFTLKKENGSTTSHTSVIEIPSKGYEEGVKIDLIKKWIDILLEIKPEIAPE